MSKPRILFVFNEPHDLQEFAERMYFSVDGSQYFRSKSILETPKYRYYLRIVRTMADAYQMAGMPFKTVNYGYGENFKVDAKVVNYLSALQREVQDEEYV